MYTQHPLLIPCYPIQWFGSTHTHILSIVKRMLCVFVCARARLAPNYRYNYPCNNTHNHTHTLNSGARTNGKKFNKAAIVGKKSLGKNRYTYTHTHNMCRVKKFAIYSLCTKYKKSWIFFALTLAHPPIIIHQHPMPGYIRNVYCAHTLKLCISAFHQHHQQQR